MSEEQQTTVKIDERLLHRIGVREWGLPSLAMEGKMWRSEQKKTITCMIAIDETNLRLETLPLEVVPAGEAQSMPDHWREALWVYVKAYPASGCGYGPFLALTEKERCDFLRKMGQQLVESDDIACRVIAHDIGLFSAADYETIEKPEPAG